MNSFSTLLMGNPRFNRWLPVLIGLILFFAVAFQSGYRIGKEQIKVWDESSSARNAVIMLADQNYFMVKKGIGRVHDHKPPFQLWLKVLSFRVFGINEFAVRFPTLLSGLLLAALLWFISAYLIRKPWIGNLVLLLMATTSGYMGYHVARHGDPDTLLTFEIFLYSILYFIFLEKYPVSRWKYLILFGFVLVIAIMTKSIAGLAPAAGLFVYTLTQKETRRVFKDYRLYLIGILSLTLALSYYFIREFFDEGYLQAVYKQNFEVLHKYPGKPKYPEFSFYFNYLLNAALKPYFHFLPFVIIPAIFSRNKQLKRFILFLFIVALVFLLGQSSALMKNEWYIAPIYPFLWLLIAIGIYETLVFILKFIKIRWLRIIVILIYTSLILDIAYPEYISIYNKNMKSTYTSNYIFEPEREGNFFRNLKIKMPDIKNIIVVSNRSQRSTDFYVQKYSYLDNTEVKVHVRKELPNIVVGDTVMICAELLKRQVEKQFEYEIVFNDRYCNLYVITNRLIPDILD